MLSRVGVASRREAERMIQLGEVSVNGKVIDSPALNVTSKDKITVRGELIGEPEEARLWLLRMMAGRHWSWVEGNHDPGQLDLGGSHH